MLVWVKLIFAGKSVILVCSGMQLFSPVTSSVAIRVIFNHWLTWITRTNKVSGCCKYGWWCVWKAQKFFGRTGPVYACLYWIVTFFPGHFFFKSFADDRTVSLHFHGLQVTVIYCSFAARSRRVVGVTVVKVWEISRRYLRRVKAGTYHSFRCDSSRSVKLPIATLPSFDDSCYKGLLVGWLASKRYTFKAYGLMQTQREFKTGICPFGKIGKHNAAWTHLNSNLSISLNISQCSKVSKVFKSQFTLHQVVHSVVSPSRCAWRLCKTRSILSHDMPWFLKIFDMPDMLKMSNDCDLPRNRGGLISMLAKFCVTFNM